MPIIDSHSYIPVFISFAFFWFAIKEPPKILFKRCNYVVNINENKKIKQIKESYREKTTVTVLKKTFPINQQGFTVMVKVLVFH